MIKRILALLLLISFSQFSWSQDEGDNWGKKFEQLGQMLPTPNEYRAGSGAPGEQYWQQRVDYNIAVTLNEINHRITGKETITYHNNSPDKLTYLWVQLDQNVREPGTNTLKIQSSGIRDSLPAKFFTQGLGVSDYDGGFKITGVTDAAGDDLPYFINKTMMRVELPEPLNSGETFEFNIGWYYTVNDRMELGGRSGYEYFPKDDNYLYTIAQFYPRMAVYDDYNGWQNKQFLGRGEFALEFGDFKVEITVPADHIVASTGWLQNPKDVLTDTQLDRFEKAKKSFDEPVIIVTEEEAIENEKAKTSNTKTWVYHAENVRDFAFATSRKFIWDAQAVKIGDKTPLAMSYYPKEGNPLWEQESTKAVKNTLVTYSKYTIDYPYPVAISVHSASIGMEYPMICFNFGRPNEDGTYSDRVKYGMIGVVIHEVGHNFFPMIINSDERQWTWMDEGLNSFVQYRTEQENYDDFPSRRGPAPNIINYMKSERDQMRPIMTNSEQILQFGNNAYGKPATALSILREAVMGPELFDAAFKEYAQRWAFKRPNPADFFRSMEDASAFDLDWFWRGWFYTVDNVDINLADVQWFRMRQESSDVENKNKNVQQGDLTASGNEGKMDFSAGPQEFSLTETDPRFYGEFMNRIDDKAVIEKLKDKNYYQLTFKNEGGLVMPIILKFVFTDGTSETIKIPAEIWRLNEQQVTKTFMFDKEVANILVDPDEQTADVNTSNNTFPRVESESKFDEFRGDNGR
jgi:hypothetical protein